MTGKETTRVEEVLMKEEPVDAFESFYQENFDAVVRAVCLADGTSRDALDITQEAFARAWEHWDRVTHVESPLLYTLRIARNLSTRNFRQALRLHRSLGLLQTGRSLDTEGQPDLRLAVEAALRRLPARQRWAIVLCDLAELQSDEAAKVMGCSPSTVRVHLARARKEMRVRLSNLAPGTHSGPLNG